jgi:SAM-dependent methyltransferase
MYMMIIYILLLVIFISIYCTTSSNKSGIFILFLLLLYNIPIQYTTNMVGYGNYRKEGGADGVINNKSVDNMVEKYTGYNNMIKKQFKYTGEKYKHSDTFYTKLYKLYKYKPCGKNKKWGNVQYESPMDLKFNNNIMNIINSIDGDGNVLDYGCGNGWSIHHFDDKTKNTVCVDIDDYRTYSKKSKFVKNTSISSIDEKIKNDSIDLVMALQSLHHIEFCDVETEYIDRIRPIIISIISKIKPGGYLLIREHDVKNNDDVCPVIFEHLLYDIIELGDKNMSFEKLKSWVKNYHMNHKGWYFSKQFLHNILEHEGMELVDTEIKKGGNVSHIYNSLYMKTCV